jgi:hypothetical protein
MGRSRQPLAILALTDSDIVRWRIEEMRYLLWCGNSIFQPHREIDKHSRQKTVTELGIAPEPHVAVDTPKSLLVAAGLKDLPLWLSELPGTKRDSLVAV